MHPAVTNGAYDVARIRNLRLLAHHKIVGVQAGDGAIVGSPHLHIHADERNVAAEEHIGVLGDYRE